MPATLPGIMEISTEISRKIPSAVKGKLQELGAYVGKLLLAYQTVERSASFISSDRLFPARPLILDSRPFYLQTSPSLGAFAFLSLVIGGSACGVFSVCVLYRPPHPFLGRCF